MTSIFIQKFLKLGEFVPTLMTFVSGLLGIMFGFRLSQKEARLVRKQRDLAELRTSLHKMGYTITVKQNPTTAWEEHIATIHAAFERWLLHETEGRKAELHRLWQDLLGAKPNEYRFNVQSNCGFAVVKIRNLLHALPGGEP